MSPTPSNTRDNTTNPIASKTSHMRFSENSLRKTLLKDQINYGAAAPKSSRGHITLDEVIPECNEDAESEKIFAHID